MKYLAIDVGQARTGLAVTDSMGIVPVPYKTVKEKNIKILVKIISEIINEIKVDKVLVGYPLSIDNTKSNQTKYVDLFIKELKKIIDENIIEKVDEKYSSFVAESLLKDVGLNRKKRSKKVDEISALVILKSYLQNHQYM